jgi:hypothetical protein
MWLLTALKKMFSNENVVFSEPVIEPLNPLYIDDKYIPEVVFDKDVGIYNCGIDKEKHVYKVLISPLEKEIIV